VGKTSVDLDSDAFSLCPGSPCERAVSENQMTGSPASAGFFFSKMWGRIEIQKEVLCQTSIGLIRLTN
jgi:hypothetical protein